MADFDLPFSRHFSLSGKFIAEELSAACTEGLDEAFCLAGSGLSQYAMRGIETVGGWAQTKFRPTSKLEFNVAVGTDNPYARDLKYFQYPQAYGTRGSPGIRAAL